MQARLAGKGGMQPRQRRAVRRWGCFRLFRRQLQLALPPASNLSGIGTIGRAVNPASTARLLLVSHARRAR